jgi:hypothetical protein
MHMSASKAGEYVNQKMDETIQTVIDESPIALSSEADRRRLDKLLREKLNGDQELQRKLQQVSDWAEMGYLGFIDATVKQSIHFPHLAQLINLVRQGERHPPTFQIRLLSHLPTRIMDLHSKRVKAW